MRNPKMMTARKKNPKKTTKKLLRKHNLSTHILDKTRQVNNPTTSSANCHPNNKNSNSKTCYSTNALVALKNAFNVQHPHKQILSDNADDIHQALYRGLHDKCGKEDCWLSALNKDDDIHYDSIFRPRGGREKKDPHTWLSNFEINKFMKQLEETYPHFSFLPATTIDFDSRSKFRPNQCVSDSHCNISLQDLSSQNPPKTKIATIINTDKETNKGEHWFSLFIDLDEHFIFYFDSVPPKKRMPKQIKKFIHRLQQQATLLHPTPVTFKIYTNLGNEHQLSTTECGLYSLFFVTTFLTRNSPFHRERQVLTLDEILQLFRVFKVRDCAMKMMRSYYFNPPTHRASGIDRQNILD